PSRCATPTPAASGGRHGHSRATVALAKRAERQCQVKLLSKSKQKQCQVKLRAEAVQVKLRASSGQVKLRAEQCQVKLRAEQCRGEAESRAVPGEAESRAVQGDEAVASRSNTVWDGVFTSLSPRTPAGVRLAAVRPAAGARLFLCAERAAQPNLHRSKQEMFVWAFVQERRRAGLRMVSELEKLAALELRLEASDSELEELRGGVPGERSAAPGPSRTSETAAMEQQEQQGNRQGRSKQAAVASNSEAIVKPRPASRPARRVRYRTEPPDDVAGRRRRRSGWRLGRRRQRDCRPGSHSRTPRESRRRLPPALLRAEAARLRMQPRWADAATASTLKSHATPWKSHADNENAYNRALKTLRIFGRAQQDPRQTAESAARQPLACFRTCLGWQSLPA
uniref:FHA domain-containing protein n=1 Tax=Macrostomum lignano TaxID=282301 RepID=A0A1I8FJR4_9PLAT